MNHRPFHVTRWVFAQAFIFGLVLSGPVFIVVLFFDWLL